MLLQTCIVGSLLLYAAFAFPDFRYRADMNVKFLEKNTFAEYYLKGEDGFQPVEFSIQPKNLNYLPKCCPYGYSYGTHQHNCIKHEPKELAFVELNSGNVNLVKTSMADCEVIVDHLVEFADLDMDDDTATVSFHGKNIEFGKYCYDYVPDLKNLTYIVRECRQKEYCLSDKTHDVCIKKCCPDGYQYIKKKCTRNPTFGIDFEPYKGVMDNYRGSFAVYHQTSTCRKYMWSNEGSVSITHQGTLVVDTNTTLLQYSIDEEMYCVEGNMVEEETGRSIPLFLLCTNETMNEFKVTRIILLISCICLLLTVVVFIIISKVRTLMGKIVTTYSIIMTIAFLLLLIVQFQPHMDTSCKPVGFCILFAFTATFAWMNVMCYEIWKTLGVMKGGIPIEEQKKVFLKYNIYAWGVPAMVILLTGLFNGFRILPDKFHPFIGETHCILENRIQQNMYGHTVFMVLPQAIMLSINGFLFVSTLRHFWKIKHEEAGLQNSEIMQARKKKLKLQKYDVKRFAMVTKLFIIMGLSWIFEVISAVIDFKRHPTLATIEMVFDIFNCLQGVLIFCVFVLNKNTLQRLLRLCSSKKKVDDDGKVSSITSSMLSAEQQEMTHHA